MTNFEYQNGRVAKVLTNNQETIYNYSCQNLLSQIKRDSEEFNYIYDGTLLKSITQKGVLNQTINIEYNSNFLPKSLEYSNKNFAIDYDSDSRVVKVGDFTVEYRGKSIITKDANYSKKIRLNGYGKIEKSKDKIFSLSLKRDGLGEIVKKVEKLNKKEIKSRYKYDLRGRLVEVKRGKKVVESYSYDANGNRVLATIYGKTYQATYNQDDQLIKYGKFSYSYNEDGYLASKSDGNSTTDYEYGIFGELKRVVTPTKTVEYLHNANHQRVTKKVDGEIREKYLWLNLTRLLAIYDKDDNLIWRFEYADSRMPIAMRDKNGTKYYLHYDQVGSLRAVSNQNGELLKEIVYDTFGNIISDSNISLKVPFGFAGGLQDRDTGLVRFGFRDYDPFTGRWTAKDPILFNGGDTNLYGYVLGDPVGGIDESGLNPDKNSVYICASSNYLRDTFHTFLCVNGRCAGLYPNPNFFKTGYTGEVRDDTVDFDMFNKDGYCVKLYTKMKGCKEKQFKQCIKEFTYIPDNMTRRDSYYPYNVITHNCRSIAGYVVIKCQIKSNCR